MCQCGERFSDYRPLPPTPSTPNESEGKSSNMCVIFFFCVKIQAPQFGGIEASLTLRARRILFGAQLCFSMCCAWKVFRLELVIVHLDKIDESKQLSLILEISLVFQSPKEVTMVPC